HVLERGLLAEERRLLVRAGHAETRQVVAREPGHVPAVEDDPTPRGWKGARDDVEQRRFPGPVRAHEGDQLPALHRERHVLERRKAAELLGDGADLQHPQRSRAAVASAAAGRERSPPPRRKMRGSEMRPPGSARMTTSSTIA